MPFTLVHEPELTEIAEGGISGNIIRSITLLACCSSCTNSPRKCIGLCQTILEIKDIPEGTESLIISQYKYTI